jgi:hypothetical protein
MMDLAISEGCSDLGVWFMNDSVSEEMQNKINDEADKIVAEAQDKLAKFLESNGYEWANGVIFKATERK